MTTTEATHHGHGHVYNETLPPLYPTSLPDTYPVGRKHPHPLVNIPDLQAHLKLLGSFHALHARVHEAANDQQKQSEAWAVFLARAVYRFQSWIQRDIHLGPADGSIPPLDVILVWHAYLLNPRAYYEDHLQRPSRIEEFPLKNITALLDSRMLDPTNSNPNSPHAAIWTSQTGLPFAPPITTSPLDRAEVQCPQCEGLSLVRVPWVTARGTGFAQIAFSAVCIAGHFFDRDQLCVRKFCNDLVQSQEDSNFFLQGSMLDSVTGSPLKPTSRRFVDTFTRAFIPPLRRRKAIEIGQDVGWQMSNVRNKIERAFKDPSHPRVRRVLSCYDHPEPFSMELVGAVLRQGTFIDKMVDMQWTKPTRFKGNEVHILVRSISRYHAFLDLMSSGVMLLVPTLDIDLSWHTHQLFSHAYRTDTFGFIGRMPDHDDKVEVNTLSNGYDTTAQAWEKRFGVPYSICGCAPTTSHSGVSDKIGKIFSKSKRHARISNTRPDLVSTEDEDADSTHPSEHNSVILADYTKSRAAREKRQRISAKRAEELVNAKAKGQLDEWTKIAVQRQERDKHDPSFNAVALYWGITPFGHQRAGGCAAYGGRVLDHNPPSCIAGAAGGVCGGGGCSSAKTACAVALSNNKGAVPSGRSAKSSDERFAAGFEGLVSAIDGLASSSGCASSNGGGCASGGGGCGGGGGGGCGGGG